jgi:glycosyltransferase involved in cell wall biosynthesis
MIISKKVKKSIFVVPRLYPSAIGGAEVFNEALIKELSLNCDIEYLTTCEDFITTAKKIQLPVVRSIIQLLFIFIRLLKVEKSRVIVTSFMKTKWYHVIIYPFLAFIWHKQYIIIIHGGGMMPWKFKTPYRWYFKKAKKVFGVSEVICKEYKQRTRINVAYLPPLIPFTISVDSKERLRKEYGFNENEHIFLSVGSLKSLKKPMTTLLAAKYLGTDFLKENNIRFVFAGDGPLKVEMQNFIQQHSLTAFITLLGNVPREKIHKVYKLSDSYIISSDFEGTPISMLEAMANNLLIIGSDVPGINNILMQSDLGFLFDRYNPKELAGIIRSSVSKNWKNKKANAKIFYTTHFSYENILQKIKAVL